jgi:tetratricopeptide (TPR) repeat protein
VSIRHCAVAALIACWCVAPPPCRAQTPCGQAVARLVSLQGIVEVQRTGASDWAPVQLDETLCAGDLLRVRELSRAALVLPNEAIVRLDQLSTISLTPPAEQPGFLLQLMQGAMHFFSRLPRTLRVATPFVNGTIEGTEVFMASTPGEGRVAVIEGALRIENTQGALVLRSGEAALVAQGQAPRKMAGSDVRQFISWTIFYPPILGLQAMPEDGTPDARLAAAGERFQAGDTTGAMAALETAGETPAALAMRASLLLYVGRVEEAGAMITRLRQLEPESAAADALRAVIAAAQNRKAEALQHGQQAATAAPRSSTALMALSIAQQANFDLAGARRSLRQATDANPGDGLAWARLAEVELATGESTEAAVAAERAALLLPQLSRVQLVHGFALLTRIRLDEALAAFEAAVARDSADPLPRLGLGLAQIRKGDLAAGRQNIEIAAALDPVNSLTRSYLGKAYFEEKRDPLAGTQFEMAKRLDPQDPTPYLYDAIRKQTQNRPVEALGDIQASIALNDNRAVYRSRLLLDEDLAVRSASLGRIYQDLGFDQLALVEGFKSVSSAPGDFSGHRFLADTYAALPRHEIARVSELLQSQLLQPLNVTPLQPALAGTNLGILEGTGPNALSINEYSPLFLRNGFSLQGSGLAGENETLSDELIHAGVWNNVSYSVGQYHYETEGFRANNDQDLDVVNAFVQTQIGAQTSLLAEARQTRSERGDLALTFLNTFHPNQRQWDDVQSMRLGFRQGFGPQSTLLATARMQRADLELDKDPLFIETDGDLATGEACFLQQSERYSLRAGVSHSRKQWTDDLTVFGNASEEDSQARFTNIYLYTDFSLHDTVRLTAGASGSCLDGALSAEDREQFNPKLGLIWTPLPATTVRAAAFRSMQGLQMSRYDLDPTLEPTQLAGINQFFLGYEADDAWRYGMGLDQKISDTLFVGAEAARRDIVTRFYTQELLPDFEKQEWREDQVRAYGYWAPASWLTVGADYLYETFERQDGVLLFTAGDFNELFTHRLSLALHLFSATGLSFSIKETYVDQHGELVIFSDAGPTTSDDSDRFWVLDASLGYRLPRRLGSIRVEGRNLLDESFKFQDTDPGNPRIMPDRQILALLTLVL